MIDSLLSKLPASLVEAMKNCEQDKSWHAEGSLYNHTVMVMEKVIEQRAHKDLLIAAIFHDLGKLDCETREMRDGEEKIHHYDHEKHSLKYIDKLSDLYYNEITDKKRVYEIVKEHMRIHKYLDGTMSNQGKRRAFELNPYFSDILAFGKCDLLGRRGE